MSKIGKIYFETTILIAFSSFEKKHGVWKFSETAKHFEVSKAGSTRTIIRGAAVLGGNTVGALKWKD